MNTIVGISLGLLVGEHILIPKGMNTKYILE